eukprot:scaffold67729_cov70-Phaeocystis_antarctica.AAC.5
MRGLLHRMRYPLLCGVAVAAILPSLLVLRGERPAQLELLPRRLCDFSNLLLQEVLVFQMLHQQLPTLGAHRVVVVRELACVDDWRRDKAAVLSLQPEPFGDARNALLACVRADDVYSLPLQPLDRSAQIVAVAPSDVAHTRISAVRADHVASHAGARRVVVKALSKDCHIGEAPHNVPAELGYAYQVVIRAAVLHRHTLANVALGPLRQAGRVVECGDEPIDGVADRDQHVLHTRDDLSPNWVDVDHVERLAPWFDRGGDLLIVLVECSDDGVAARLTDVYKQHERSRPFQALVAAQIWMAILLARRQVAGQPILPPLLAHLCRGHVVPMGSDLLGKLVALVAVLARRPQAPGVPVGLECPGARVAKVVAPPGLRASLYVASLVRLVRLVGLRGLVGRR